MNSYTRKSFVALIRTFNLKLVNKSAYWQCVTKNDVQNVHRQPAHKLTNDDATGESLQWRLRDPGWTTSKQEKYLITHLHALSIAMEHAKNYEIRCKIIWNIRTIRMAPFLGNVIYDFLAQKFYKVV